MALRSEPYPRLSAARHKLGTVCGIQSELARLGVPYWVRAVRAEPTDGSG